MFESLSVSEFMQCGGRLFQALGPADENKLICCWLGIRRAAGISFYLCENIFV